MRNEDEVFVVEDGLGTLVLDRHPYEERDVLFASRQHRIVEDGFGSLILTRLDPESGRPVADVLLQGDDAHTLRDDLERLGEDPTPKAKEVFDHGLTEYHSVMDPITEEPDRTYRLVVSSVREDMSRWHSSVADHVEGIHLIFLYNPNNQDQTDLVEARVQFREETPNRLRETLNKEIQESLSYLMPDRAHLARFYGGTLYEEGHVRSKEELDQRFSEVLEELRNFPSEKHVRCMNVHEVHPLEDGEQISGRSYTFILTPERDSVIVGLTNANGSYQERKIPVEAYINSDVGIDLYEPLGKYVQLSHVDGKPRISIVSPEEAMGLSVKSESSGPQI